MPTVLDCTFRDGGYKTDWKFNDNEVERHIAGTTADVIEIGYRAEGQGSGIYRYCPDEHINKLQIPADSRIAVMLNAREWAQGLFRAKPDSRIDIVRVATHLEAIAESEVIVSYLRNLGYFVTLNIMQAHRAEDSVFDREYDADVVYFADSFGTMSGVQVASVTKKLKRHNNNVGFHGHNNTLQALSNTLTAMRHGATWLDATVDGMGRGAGNTDLAALLSSLGR